MAKARGKRSRSSAAKGGVARSAKSAKSAKSPKSGKPTKSAKASASSGGAGDLVVVYIHGIGNKPRPAELKAQWDHALFGRAMGSRTRMAYWADTRYTAPLSGAAAKSLASVPQRRPSTSSTSAIRERILATAARDLGDRKALDFATKVTDRLLGHEKSRARGPSAKALPVPRWLRRWITERITRAFIHDTAAYFYDAEDRDAMRARLRAQLVGGPTRYVVVAHSQGSIIAYDVLRALKPADGVNVELLVTIGSPLGVQEVQDHVTKPLEIPAVVGEWRNFADSWDPVALDADLANDYAARPNARIVDKRVKNLDAQSIWSFDPHSSTGYLGTREVQSVVRAKVGARFLTAMPSFVIAKDVANEMADSIAGEVRLPVLIELDEKVEGEDLEDKAKGLAKEIGKIVAKGALDEANVDILRRYVAVRLTPSEVDNLATRHKDLSIARIWKNSRKRALIATSAHVIQSYTARLGYRATGKGIVWAVLDTGVEAKHPHFADRKSIAKSFDCTKRGEPKKGGDSDPDGHGTHVAGIIAGGMKGPDVELLGIAPEAKLYTYKVLDDDGSGDDAWIIKAIDHIAETNERAGKLVIHGVNLSLGGPFDAEVFGCGHSPLCRELRRLWQQGVVVCLAAGNEGRTVIETVDGEQEISLDLSIGDPANLDEAIAVGSVHRDFPHLYGVSYFSSRGPTADGRLKPDLVAPGEKIESANSGYDKRDPETYYVAMSGTSMACPQVSGVVAAFLSVRREFIGRPDRVKEILLGHCTDLRRDHYHQGAGMPNLVKMLTDT